MKKMTERTINSIREMKRKPYSSYGLIVNAWSAIAGTVQGGRVDDERAI